MFALVMCEDRISMQGRRNDIIQGLKNLPGIIDMYNICHNKSIYMYHNKQIILLEAYTVDHILVNNFIFLVIRVNLYTAESVSTPPINFNNLWLTLLLL